MPTAGTITAISAQFNITAAVSVSLGNTTILASVYVAKPGTNVYLATGVAVKLAPVISGGIAVGTVLYGSASGFSYYVPAGSNILLVFSASNDSVLSLATTITGSVSAGLAVTGA